MRYWSNTKSRALLAICLGLLAGCAGSGDGADDNLLLNLNATQANAGSIGQAMLVAQGDQTDLSIFVGGVPPGVSKPLSLLTYVYAGSCSTLADKPTYALNNTSQTLQVAGGWRLAKSIPASLADLRSGEFALVLSTSAADRAENIFCAEIK